MALKKIYKKLLYVAVASAALVPAFSAHIDSKYPSLTFDTVSADVPPPTLPPGCYSLQDHCARGLPGADSDDDDGSGSM